MAGTVYFFYLLPNIPLIAVDVELVEVAGACEGFKPNRRFVEGLAVEVGLNNPPILVVLLLPKRDVDFYLFSYLFADLSSYCFSYFFYKLLELFAEVWLICGVFWGVLYFSGIVGAIDFINSGEAEVTKDPMIFYVFTVFFSPCIPVAGGFEKRFPEDPLKRLLFWVKDGVEVGYFLENAGREPKNDFLGFSTFASLESSSFFLPKRGELEELLNRDGALVPNSGNLDPANKFLVYYFEVPA